MPLSKVERAQAALDQFLAPKLRDGAAFDSWPFFHGLNDRNVADHIDAIIGAVARATSGDLVCDAATPELRAKLKKAVDDEPAKVDDAAVMRVLALLEGRLTPSELMAVKDILTKPKQRGEAVREAAEDAANARIAYDARWPDATRIKVEPACAPERREQAASPTAGYFERFPDAQRIGRA